MRVGQNGLSVAVAAQPVLEDRYPVRRNAFANGVVALADVTYAVLPGFRPLPARGGRH